MEKPKKPKLLYSLQEVLELIPLSKSGIYKLCAEEKIAPEYIARIGKRIFIKASWIEQFESNSDKTATNGNAV